jgi:hypothetical protein
LFFVKWVPVPTGNTKIVNYGITIAFMSQVAVRLCYDVPYRCNVKVQTTAQNKERIETKANGGK